jgi:hypothetical protein
MSPMSPIRATPPNPIEEEDDDEDEDDSCGRWPICHLSSVFCHLSFVICHSSRLPLTIGPISNDSVHRETDAGVGGGFVLRG